MRREAIRKRRESAPGARRRGGFALVAALAVLVLLASIGSMMLRLTGVQQARSSISILGARAHLAARSGIEWGLHRAAVAGTCPAASTALVLGEGALEGFRVEVTCSATTHVEGTHTRTHVVLRARAEFADPDAREHVVREVGASAVL
ncbi:MAG: pilus assembly protein MshP [Myxococcota bacterium]